MKYNFSVNSNIITNTPLLAKIDITPTMQEKILNKILVQSSGISVGVIIAIVGAIVSFKYLGVNKFFEKFITNMDSTTLSLHKLTDSIAELIQSNRDDRKDYQHYFNDLTTVLNNVKHDTDDIKQALRDKH